MPHRLLAKRHGARASVPRLLAWFRCEGCRGRPLPAERVQGFGAMALWCRYPSLLILDAQRLGRAAEAVPSRDTECQPTSRNANGNAVVLAAARPIACLARPCGPTMTACFVALVTAV